MKKTLLSSALLISMASTSVSFAHHPAADIVDPEIYAMIDENVSDTPHAELTFEDMGRDMEEAASAMEARGEMEARADMDERGQMEDRADFDNDDRGQFAESSELPGEGGTDREFEAEAAIDTIDLLENVTTVMAE